MEKKNLNVKKFRLLRHVKFAMFKKQRTLSIKLPLKKSVWELRCHKYTHSSGGLKCSRRV